MVLLNMPGQRGYLQKISPNIDFLKEWMPTVKKHNNTTVYKKTAGLRNHLRTWNVRIEIHQL